MYYNSYNAWQQFGEITSPQPLGGGFQDATSAWSILVSHDASWCVFGLFSAVYTFLGIWTTWFHPSPLPVFSLVLFSCCMDRHGVQVLNGCWWCFSVSLWLFSSFTPVMLFSSIFCINDKPATTHVNSLQPMTSFNMFLLRSPLLAHVSTQWVWHK